MSDSKLPNPHHVSTKKALLILGIALAGVALGSYMVLPHMEARLRRGSALSHVVPQSFISREKNGMMWIPSGAFFMVSENPAANEAVTRLVTLNGFWMDKTEVTNDEFRKFAETTGFKTAAERKGAPNTWLSLASPERGGHPVVWVDWSDAVAYAQWAGKRLPTEAEWECAARGGLDRKPFPWGSDNLPNGLMGGRFATNSTCPAGAFQSNGYGLSDMAGNVAEWCADFFGPLTGDAVNNPHGPKDSITGERVVRGGSYLSTISQIRVAERASLAQRESGPWLGFRCVR